MKFQGVSSWALGWCVLSGFGVSAFAGTYNGPPGGPGDAAENEAIFKQYCVGSPNSADIPGVNFSNPEVLEAIHKMAGVKDKNYYFYSPVLKAYQLGKNGALVAPPANAPKELTPGGNAFLVQLCGEFRDRATLIRERIQWLRKLYKLPTTVPTAYDPSGDPWAQMSAHWYIPYIQLSSSFFEAKKQELVDAGKDHVTFGKQNEDTPIEGTDGCEMKYIFSEYISKNRVWDSLAQFRLGYEPFKQKYCTAEDVSFYYDFRGDKNFKHNSPEGNAMIWTASSIASQCATPTMAKPGSPLSNADCQNYFTKPFLSRWNGARAGLATWLFRDSKYNEQFEIENGNTTIFFNAKDLTKPFSFLMGTDPTVISEMLPEFNAIPDAMSRPDMGYNLVTGAANLVSPTWNIDLQYERLRDAVNHHTNWYGSGYDDHLPSGVKQTQFYSPFVASSYEMSASDGFAAEQSGSRKAWMFVFKVKKENWYNTNSIVNRVQVNFDTQWMDETSLGTQGYAESERAFDRLGTSIEGEHVAVLYLHNIYGSDVISDDLTDEEVQKAQDLAAHSIKPGFPVFKAAVSAQSGLAVNFEYQGKPESWVDPVPEGSPPGTVGVKHTSFNPSPIWVTLSGGGLTAGSKVEAKLSYTTASEEPTVQKFLLTYDTSVGAFKGYAADYSQDVGTYNVSFSVTVDGQPVSFGPGPMQVDSVPVDLLSPALIP